MNFSRGKHREEPEINFVPLIDVMLVILIFLMATTSYAKFSELKITLPSAQATQPQDKPFELNIAITRSGDYSINGKAIKTMQTADLSLAMQQIAAGQKDAVVVISADEKAEHQSVIRAMEAAQQAGYPKLSFATQSATGQ